MRWLFVLSFLASGALAGATAGAAGWSRIGADPGLSKYTSSNIPAAASLQLQYSKRFYGKYAATRGNFFYGSSIVTRNGKAIIIADDRQNPSASNYVAFLQFDWATGQADAYYTTSWLLSENSREIDSHHYTNPIIWHDDDRVYMRRGGDNSGTHVFLPTTGDLIPIYYRDAQGAVLPKGIDAAAFMQAYRDMLIYRYDHTFYTKDYWAVSIAEACFAAPNVLEGRPDVLGRWITDVGPSVPETAGSDGLYGFTGRYGDIPKCANDVCVMAGLVRNKLDVSPNDTKVWLEATDLAAATTLWTKTWTSDIGGQQGFGTSVSDYWRFIATDSGHYVFFTRAPQQPAMVRAVDLRTGQEKWSKALSSLQERPLLAYHAGYVYVIGRTDQYKLDVYTGTEIWHTTHSWPHDQGYVLGNHDLGSAYPVSQDPLYRPAVLTDDTLWFVDGDGTANSYIPTAATLIGIRTRDGQVVQQIDLRSCYSDRPGESLLVVNDILVADQLLGVLVGVRSDSSAYPNTNGMDYQDLYVFKAIRPGDINGDSQINIGDFQLLIAAWNSSSSDSRYNAAADLNQDDYINVGDLQILITAWTGS